MTEQWYHPEWDLPEIIKRLEKAEDILKRAVYLFNVMPRYVNRNVNLDSYRLASEIDNHLGTYKKP